MKGFEKNQRALRNIWVFAYQVSHDHTFYVFPRICSDGGATPRLVGEELFSVLGGRTRRKTQTPKPSLSKDPCPLSDGFLEHEVIY